MELHSVRIPKDEVRKFELRAQTFYPTEIEDYLIGRHWREAWEVHLILPTRIDEIATRTEGEVTLFASASDRATETARSLGLSVLGSIHTHPYKPNCGGGPMLSQTDWEGFAEMETWMANPPLQGICAIYRTGRHPDKYEFWWRFWRKDSSLRVKFNYSRSHRAARLIA